MWEYKRNVIRPTFQNVMDEIEKQCHEQTGQVTVELQQAWAWSANILIRQSHPEIADKISLQLGAVQ